MSYSFRSQVAHFASLALAISPAPPTFAHSGRAALPVSLVIRDICTMETSAPRPSVSCAGGGPYRILSGEFFATLKAVRLTASADRNASIVEVAF